MLRVDVGLHRVGAREITTPVLPRHVHTSRPVGDGRPEHLISRGGADRVPIHAPARRNLPVGGHPLHEDVEITLPIEIGPRIGPHHVPAPGAVGGDRENLLIPRRVADRDPVGGPAGGDRTPRGHALSIDVVPVVTIRVVPPIAPRDDRSARAVGGDYRRILALRR